MQADDGRKVRFDAVKRLAPPLPHTWSWTSTLPTGTRLVRRFPGDDPQTRSSSWLRSSKIVDHGPSRVMVSAVRWQQHPEGSRGGQGGSGAQPRSPQVVARS